jgi:hypothetical protein
VVSGVEGPGARVIGVWSAGHPIELSYTPAPYTEAIGTAPNPPSLYEAQVARRKR